MQWRELVEKVGARAGTTPEEAQLVLDAFSDLLLEAMEEEDSIQLRRDLGSFAVRDHGGTQAANQRHLYAKRHRTVVFKASNDLKKRLRQSDEEYDKMLEERDLLRQGAPPAVKAQ